MAKARTCEEKPAYKCLLCLTDCNVPRQLPCFHAFCTDCLNTYIRAEHAIADNKSYVPCPICETPCFPANPESPVSSWATSFPLHPVFTSPADMVAESEETFCHGCLRCDENNLAEFWCHVCTEALCKQCRVVHRKNKILSQHKVIDISDVKKTGVTLPVDINETCPQHIGKLLEVYCLDHNAPCCVLCATISHRACQHVKSIDEVAKKITTGHMETELIKVKDETKRIVDEDENKLTTLDSDYQAMTNDMTTVIQTAKNKLDDMHARFQGRLDQTYKRNKDSLSKRLRTNNEFQANVYNTSQLQSLMNERGSDRQKLIVEEQSKTQLAGHFRRFQQKTKDKHNTFDMKIRYDETLTKINNVMTTVGCLEESSSLSSLSQNALASIGTTIDTIQTTPSISPFTDSSSSSDMVSAVKMMRVQPSPGPQRVDLWTGSLSLVKSVQSSTLGGSSAWLTGGLFVDGEGLLITDHNNSRLLLFDDHYNYVRQYGVDGGPSDVIHGFTSNEVLVSLYNKQTILRCTLRGGVLTTVSRISVPNGTCGIAVLGDNILTGTRYAVQIITTNGTQIKSISKHGNNTYIAVSQRGDFYHKDNDVIVCRSRDGQEVFRHTCQGIRDIEGIDVDQESNVYICGRESGDVHLVSADGSRGRVLIPKLHGITNLWAVMVHPTKQEIVVTSYNEKVAFEVFKFCDQ